MRARAIAFSAMAGSSREAGATIPILIPPPRILDFLVAPTPAIVPFPHGAELGLFLLRHRRERHAAAGAHPPGQGTRGLRLRPSARSGPHGQEIRFSGGARHAALSAG